MTSTANIYVQEYVPPLIDPATATILAIFGGGSLVLFGLAYYGYKMATAGYGAKWDATETTTVAYESPEITIETFGEPGTVADLDPIESAFFVNKRRQEIVTMIMMSCVRKGVVRIISSKPLRLSKTGIKFEDLTYYEEMFLEAIESNELVPEKVEAMLEELADRVQKKSWDADFETTKEAHEERVDGAWEEMESQPTVSGRTDYYFDGTYGNYGWSWYWIYMHSRHDDGIPDVISPTPG
ncbi:MAG: hypothetical protein ACQET3_12435, partial [Promethearchaeati archaeon]